MNLIQISFLIFIFLKQFYIFNSGSLQLGDLFFILSFVLYIFRKSSKFNIKINQNDKLFILFVYIGLFINTVYFMIYKKLEFLVSSVHFIYNLLVIILFRQLIKDQYFIKNIISVFKVNIILQMFIYILGIGRYYLGERYMGSFNDPNQFAFFIYISFMFIVILSNITLNKVNIIYYLIVLFLVFQSSSTGMLVGIAIFTIIHIFISNIKIIKKSMITKSKIIKIIILTFILIVLFIPI